jgi:protein JSN1
MAMLEHISPHLAMIGNHRIGFRAARKIMESMQTTEEINLIVQNLRPYALPLLRDRFGCHVIQ